MDCKWQIFCDGMIIGLSLGKARRSIMFDIVDRLVMGQTFFRLVESRPVFLRSGVIQPVFIEIGKQPAVKDRLVRWQMTMAISEWQVSWKNIQWRGFS